MRFVPGARGSGIPQAIAALHLKQREVRDRLLSLKNAVGKVVLTIAGLGCGAWVGREGPTVQIGRGSSALVCRESLYQTLARPFMGIHDRRGMHRRVP